MRHPIWWSTPTTRGDEHCHGVATHYQSLYGHLLQKDTKTAFHQNEARTAETIKKGQGPLCSSDPGEAEAMHPAAIWEVEAKFAVAIREAETASVDHAHKLQQSHRESMQNIEREAIEEEGWDHQSFLNACRAALQVCPLEACGVLMFPLQLLTRNMSLATLLVTTPSQPPP